MDTIDIALNRQGHGLEFEALVDTLVQSKRNGWIALGRPFQADSLPVSDLDADEVAAFLREHGRGLETMHYWLTPDGGAVWESFARPRWDRYVGHCDEFPEDDSSFERMTIIETSEWQWLDKYLRAQASEQVVEAGSITLAELRPWQPTYWKTLPFGLRCTFRSAEHRLRSCSTADSSRFRESWREWR